MSQKELLKFFSDVLNELEKDTLKDDSDTLILDLRNNPGGALTALHNKSQSGLIPGITQQLIIRNVEKPLFSMVNKNNIREDYLGGLVVAKPYDIKVLVNENSASAAACSSISIMVVMIYTVRPTYGKSVFQNTALLRTLNGISYYLTYTEGSWAL